MFNKIKNDRVKDLLKKYALLYVLYGESALKDLSGEDKRILKVAYDKYIK